MPFVMVTQSDGQVILDLAGTPGANATLEVGTSIPEQGENYGESIGVYDLATGVVNITDQLPSLPFDYVFSASIGEGQGPDGEAILYVYENAVDPPELATGRVASVRFSRRSRAV